MFDQKELAEVGKGPLLPPHRGSDVHHCCIAGLGVGRWGWHVHPILCHLGKPHQHGIPWDFDMVKPQESIVHAVVPKFGPDVAHLHAWQGAVGLHVANLNHESVGPMVLSSHNQPSHENHMRGRLAQASRPPLRGGECGRVDDEAAGGGVIHGDGLQPTQECSMAQFSLGIGSHDLEAVAHGQPLGLLLWGALGENGWNEHSNVQLKAAGPEEQRAHVNAIVNRELLLAHKVPVCVRNQDFRRMRVMKALQSLILLGQHVDIPNN